jgi:hypothetical protein
VRAALASAFRGLCTRTHVHAELDETCRAIAANQFWPDGWHAVRQVLRHDLGAFPPEIVTHLRELEQALRPKDLVEQVRVIVLPSSIMSSLDMIDDTDDVSTGVDQAQTLARNLRSAVAVESQALDTLLPDLVIGDGLRWQFGLGLAEGAQDVQSIWGRLLAGFERAPQPDRRSLVLCGFLHGVYGRDTKHAGSLLDHVLTDPITGVWFPVLQAAVPIGQEGALRLARALEIGMAPAHMYQALAHGRAADSIPGNVLASLLRTLSTLRNGLDTAIEILHMRLFSDSDQKQPHHRALVAFGRELLLQMGLVIRTRDKTTDSGSHRPTATGHRPTAKSQPRTRHRHRPLPTAHVTPL